MRPLRRYGECRGWKCRYPIRPKSHIGPGRSGLPPREEIGNSAYLRVMWGQGFFWEAVNVGPKWDWLSAAPVHVNGHCWVYRVPPTRR